MTTSFHHPPIRYMQHWNIHMLPPFREATKHNATFSVTFVKFPFSQVGRLLFCISFPICVLIIVTAYTCRKDSTEQKWNTIAGTTKLLLVHFSFWNHCCFLLNPAKAKSWVERRFIRKGSSLPRRVNTSTNDDSDHPFGEIRDRNRTWKLWKT